MKPFLKIACFSLISLLSLSVQAQRWEVAKNTTFVPASSANRWGLDGNATGIGQVNNSGVFSRFALFSELSALTNGAVTSVNSKTVTGGTSDISLTSANIPESVNLYYTDLRARSAITFSGPLAINTSTGAVTFTGTPAVVGLGNVANSLQVINAGNVVSFGGGTFASRPAAGTSGRYYIATDQGATYFDNGTTWTLQEPAVTGDVAIPMGTTTSTLATVNSNVGSFGSATTVPILMLDAKGRVTAASSGAITPAGIGAAALSQVIPVSGVSTYAGLTGVTAPAAGTLKFVQVATDGQYTDSDDIYVIKPSGKIHKLPLLPAEN